MDHIGNELCARRRAGSATAAEEAERTSEPKTSEPKTSELRTETVALASSPGRAPGATGLVIAVPTVRRRGKNVYILGP